MNSNYGFRFREWQVYKDARVFRKELSVILKTYPREELYSLVDQTKRALNSIILNLVEGSNKNSDKETRVYINRSQGSLDEVVSCLDCAFDDGYITETVLEEYLKKSENLAKQLKGFSSHLSAVND